MWWSPDGTHRRCRRGSRGPHRRSSGDLRAALGGGPYNTARTIGRLGGQVAFLGSISRDHFGERLALGLTDDGVDLADTVRTESPTTLALAELDGTGTARYRFYVDGTAAPGVSGEAAMRALEQHPWALHVGTLGLVFEPIGTSIESLVGRLPADDLRDARSERPSVRDPGPGRLARADRTTVIARCSRARDHR